MFNTVDINSFTNTHPDLYEPIYPRLSPQDSPYSIAEASLRSALFIPATFGNGKNGKIPVLLVPGTGSYGGEAFESNFIKLLRASRFGDPCWLNVPGRMCGDATKNAEHIAYAINYLATSCNAKIAVVAWSQGNLAVQWSFKYWPSTRDQVSNFIALCADFHGTTSTKLLAPVPGVSMPPAVKQQARKSDFIVTLLSNGGDSAYVPTTSIYSATDEIVQPQFGKWASAILKDARGVGVTMCEVQAVARGKRAGMWYTHFSLLVNPLAWALTEDAILHGGPGRINRLDMSVCKHFKAPGITAGDLIKTSSLNLKCGKALLSYSPKASKEPAQPVYCVAEGRTYIPVDDERLRRETADFRAPPEYGHGEVPVAEVRADVKVGHH